MSVSPSYDNLTSSSVNLPAEIRISKFAEARIKEIKTLTALIDEPKEGALPSQQLPKHLRRRAVSHNPNRLPKRLRERHIRERAKSNEGSEKVGRPKRPSRRFRRRPSNLLSEYNRRQRKAKWLETHIWHAKRFHMTPATSKEASEDSRWGYKLADFPNDKSFRACYRAVAKKCLMQDISYYCCIEVSGPQELVIDGLNELTGHCETIKSSFSSPQFLETAHEGTAWVFHPKHFPRRVVGKIRFLWKPTEEGTNRTIWLWAHPAFYNEFFEILSSVFSLRKEEAETKTEPDSPPTKKLKFVDKILQQKLEIKNVPGSERVPIFSGCFRDSTIIVRELKDTLNRFRLQGPLSQTILKNSLQPTSFLSGSESKSSWWKNYFKDDDSLQEFSERQKNFWSKFDHFLPGAMPSGLVFGLVVRDPRKILPPKRGCQQLPITKNESFDKKNYFQNAPLQSPMWDMEIRDQVTVSKVPDHEINKQRSELLMAPQSGVDLEFSTGALPVTEEESRIPVILIQHPGSKDQPGFGAGWDIILPAGWGMPFWLNFIFRGARVGGLREKRQLDLEMGRLGDLDNAPDSRAGKLEMEREKKILKAVHLRHPPDKRPNYAKLGSASPFEAPWSILVHDWTQKFRTSKPSTQDSSDVTKCDFYVLRDTEKLSDWKKLFKCSSEVQSKISDLKIADSEDFALLPIQITISKKGTLGHYTMVCLPTRSDLEQFFTASDAPIEPTEPLQPDDNEEKRKLLKIFHTKEKLKLKNECKEIKNKIDVFKAQVASTEILSQKECKVKIDTESLSQKIDDLTSKLNDLKAKRIAKNSEFSDQMGKLWVDDINCEDLDFIPTVRNSSAREILGYVQFGGISYRTSHHSGQGYAPVSAVKQLLEFYTTLAEQPKSVYVLVRQPHSLQYRFAKLSIADDV